MKVSQREAVYSAITSTFTENQVDFEDGQNVSEVLTDDMRASVHQILCEGFKRGDVAFEDTPSNREKLASDSKLNSYVSGLISNWVRKDTRFNGNTKYVAKNPGSRAGQGDSKLKTLRALKKQFVGTPKESAIDSHITKRVEEIQAERAKSTELTAEQIAMIPSDLREKLGLEA
jgi:hypothetical protein